MNDAPSTPEDDFRSGTNPLVRAQFTRELTSFLASKIDANETWPGLKNEDLVSGIVSSVKSISKRIPNGMGLALLLGLSYAAQDEALADDSSFDQKEQAKSRDSKATDTPSSIEIKQFENSEDDFSSISFSGQPQSPLFKLGYSAAANGPTVIARRNLLTIAFRSNAEDAFSSHEALARWGDPETPRRLFAIASFLVWLIDFQGVDKPNAKAKWLSDLDWLKQNLYTSEMKFPWPAVTELSTRTSRHSPSFMKPMVPSPALAAIVGTDPLPRSEVTKKVWEYIKTNKLQDKINRRAIKVDSKLMSIFGKTKVTMFEMTKLISDHLSRT